MPASVVLHEGNALALDGLDDDSGGLTGNGASVCKCCLDCVEVVAVDSLNDKSANS